MKYTYEMGLIFEIVWNKTGYDEFRIIEKPRFDIRKII